MKYLVCLGLLAATATLACTHTERSASVPAIADMRLAVAGEKVGAPVDLHYAIQGVVARQQATAVALAVVPRVAGTNLRVEIMSTHDVAVETSVEPLAIPRAGARAVYRQTVSATPLERDGGTLQVIVSMDVEGGRYASVFNLPLARAQRSSQ